MGNKNKATPLHLAALWGHADVCKKLLAAGADASLETKKHKTPLQTATEEGKRDAAQVLAEHTGVELKDDDIQEGTSHTVISKASGVKGPSGFSKEDKEKFDGNE